MTMTPERLDEIRSDIESYENHQRYGPHELPYRTIERLECDEFPEYIVELLAAYDSLTAENATLKGEVEAWKSDAERHCRNELYYMGLLDEIAKNFGRAAYTSDDGSIQQDPLRAKMPELVATLRTHLKAVTEAVNEAIDIAENIRNLDPKIGADELIVALRSVIDKAKGIL